MMLKGESSVIATYSPLLVGRDLQSATVVEVGKGNVRQIGADV